MPNQQKYIIISIENGIQKIIINRPAKKNSFITSMYKDLIKTLKESESNNNIVASVITGNGDFYSSGNDFISNTNESFDVNKQLDIIREFIETIILYPKLLIAIVNGPAIGIAATTLALFDMVYASEKAYFQTPFCILGISPEACSTYTFPKIMGQSMAGDMLYFGKKLSAKEALQNGFISKIYKSDAKDEIWKHLEKISSLSKESLLATKKLVGQWNKNLLLQINKQEISELKKTCTSEFFMENLSKFIAKKSKL